MLKRMFSLLIIGVLVVSTSMVSFADASLVETTAESQESLTTIEELMQEDLEEFNAMLPAKSEVHLENFKTVKEYVDGQFTDIPANAWYLSGVKKAYIANLMNGTREDRFNPNGNVSIAEAITLAARIHSIYYADGYEFAKNEGEEWYQPYVDYALANYMIIPCDYKSYTKPATRMEFAKILIKALPAEALENINTISSEGLPDLQLKYRNEENYEVYNYPVFKLYCAGVLSGNDKYGTFAPNSNVKRSEVATIACRMINPSERKHFKLSRHIISTVTDNGKVTWKYDASTNTRKEDWGDSISVLTFDDNGSRIKLEGYKNDTLTHTIYYSVNALGDTYTLREYEPSGRMKSAWRYLYDDEGKLLMYAMYETSWMDGHAYRFLKQVYEYRPDGQLDKTLDYLGDATEPQVYNIKYDSLGKRINESIDVFYYDNEGKLIQIDENWREGLYATKTYTYYPDGTMKTKTVKDANGKTTYYFEYNAQGKEVKEIDWEHGVRYERIFNSDGTTKQVKSYSDGKLYCTTNYTYLQ